MATINHFKDIEAWKLSRQLCKEIWTIINQGTFAKDWGLRDQINRSSGSTMDNIAEGFGRGGNSEFIQFLYISRASNNEVQSQLIRAYDRQHIDQKQFQHLYKLAQQAGGKTGSFIDYLKSTNLKGHKFNK